MKEQHDVQKSNTIMTFPVQVQTFVLVYAILFLQKPQNNNRKEKPIVNSKMAELDNFVFMYTKSTKFLKLIEFTKQKSNMMYENHYNLNNKYSYSGQTYFELCT